MSYFLLDVGSYVKYQRNIYFSHNKKFGIILKHYNIPEDLDKYIEEATPYSFGDNDDFYYFSSCEPGRVVYKLLIGDDFLFVDACFCKPAINQAINTPTDAVS